MTFIEVLAGISVPYEQDIDTKQWSSTVGHTWKVENKSVLAFAKEADAKIKRRAKNHGKIPFPPKPKSLAESFVNHLDTSQNISFEKFIKTVQISNGISLKTSRVQTKVVLIFLKYKTKRQDSTEENPIFVENLLVVLLKDKSALRFNDDGEPVGTEIIDFEDVMQGAIIDIEEFTKAITDKENIDISFINGLGGTTNYFIDFFDAEEVIKNKESVNNVLKAFDDFSTSKKLSRAQKELCAKKIKSKIDYNERNKFTTKLTEIGDIIYDTLKTDKKLDIKKNSFEGFVYDFNYKVNEEFNIGKSDRDTLEYISFETEVGNLKLKKSLINKQQELGNINFNKNNNELVVRTKIKDQEIINELTKLQDNE
ncbi:MULTISPECIES: nucleoid-associated protein [Pseudoalteromonas]|jgi:nucleoid-associated protein YejK|uniref:nucleoid-associated protein n=1 Tax=Pseudoalteromonas TaxID=53246 RepID=UPI003001629F|tara:strand:+ start:317 stop:1420 length:1104 start_codon:yes stop_codon:yes gene_type:complete